VYALNRLNKPVGAVEQELFQELLKAAAETHEITVILPNRGLAKIA